jgi:broad specificity phosphatase PhoE
MAVSVVYQKIKCVATMVKVIWLGPETRCRDLLPYVQTLHLLGLQNTELIHHDDFLPTVTNDEGEAYILIISLTEDQSYGEGSWGWSTPSHSPHCLTYEELLPFVRSNTTVILVHSDPVAHPIDPRIQELSGVHIERTYSEVMNRIITDCINANEIQIPDPSLPLPIPLGVPGAVTIAASDSSALPPSIDSELSSLPLVKRIVFVRHAQRLDEVDPHWADLAQRPQDTPLTPMGIEQSQYLGRWLSDQSWCGDICALFVSPFVRTVQTAHFALTACASTRGAKTSTDIPLNIEYGLSEGAAWMSNNNQCRTPWHLSAADLLCLSQSINLAYASVRVPEFIEGPSYPGRPVEKGLWYDRCAQTIWRLVRKREYAQRTIVLVTHAGCVGLLVHALSGRELPMVGHTAVTSLVWSESTGKYEIELKATGSVGEVFVQQDHLPPDMRTGTY